MSSHLRFGRRGVGRKIGNPEIARRRSNRGRARTFLPSCELMEDRTLLAAMLWANAASGDWDTPGNWDLDRVPTAADDVVIDVAGITVTHGASASDAINSLTSIDPLVLSDGTLSIASTSSISSAFTMSGGTLTGAEARKGVTVSVPDTFDLPRRSGLLNVRDLMARAWSHSISTTKFGPSSVTRNRLSKSRPSNT